MPKAQIFSRDDNHVSPALAGKRYPRIQSIRVIVERGMPSATVKLVRREHWHGGPEVTRVYYVYDRRTICRWLRAEVALALGEPFRFAKAAA